MSIQVIREFLPEDIDKIDLVYDADGIFTEEAIAMSNHPSITIIHDGVIIALFGIVLCKNDIGLGWVIPSKHVKKNKKFFSKAVKQYLEAFSATFGLKKIITNCINSRIRERFLEYLGFRYWRVLDNNKLYIMER
jgi:hypothetical protein